MEGNLIHRIYDFVNHIIHLDNNFNTYPVSENPTNKRNCPITGLDISMQPKNSKFLSYTGVKWYYDNDRSTYLKVLAPMLSKTCKRKDLTYQFRSIAHNIRNKDSNPRNNTRRAISKLLEEKDCLFDNRRLIDSKRLIKANIHH
jgi:hypothetical protein